MKEIHKCFQRLGFRLQSPRYKVLCRCDLVLLDSERHLLYFVLLIGMPGPIFQVCIMERNATLARDVCRFQMRKVHVENV